MPAVALGLAGCLQLRHQRPIQPSQGVEGKNEPGPCPQKSRRGRIYKARLSITAKLSATNRGPTPRRSLVEEYDRQIRLLRTLKYWYIIPLWLGLMLVSAAYRSNQGCIMALLLAGLFTAVSAALWWFNEITGVRSFQRQELIAMTRENGARV
jgi:hypothetical protein